MTLATTPTSLLPQFSAERPGGLVLEGLHLEAGVGAVLDFDFLLAGDGAGVAGGLGGEEVVADDLAGEGFSAFELGFLGVPGAEAADRVDDVHEHVGAERRESAGALLEGAVGIDAGGGGDGRFEDQAEVGALGGAELVALRAALGAPAAGVGADGDDRLEVLGAGDSAGAAAGPRRGRPRS